MRFSRTGGSRGIVAGLYGAHNTSYDISTMNATRPLAVMLLLLFAASPLMADLDDFRRDIEEEERRREDESPREDRAEERDSDESGGSLAHLLFLFLYWGEHNLGVQYEPFPYTSNPAARHHFIRSAPSSAGRGYYRSSWFELTSSFIRGTDETGAGGFISLQGRLFPLLGPDIDYRVLHDGDDTLHITTVGVDVPFFQFDPLASSFYVKGAFFSGLLDRSGVAGGVTFRSFLLRPVSMYLRLGAVAFDEIDFAQVEARLNVHIRRTFVFGGVNYLESDTTSLTTYEAGIGVFF